MLIRKPVVKSGSKIQGGKTFSFKESLKEWKEEFKTINNYEGMRKLLEKMDDKTCEINDLEFRYPNLYREYYKLHIEVLEKCVEYKKSIINLL